MIFLRLRLRILWERRQLSVTLKWLTLSRLLKYVTSFSQKSADEKGVINSLGECVNLTFSAFRAKHIHIHVPRYNIIMALESFQHAPCSDTSKNKTLTERWAVSARKSDIFVIGIVLCFISSGQGPGLGRSRGVVWATGVVAGESRAVHFSIA